MRMLLSLIGLCAAVVSAIDITAPILNSTYAAGSDLTVEWTTVDTDPSDFSIYLVNFVYWPPSYVALSLNVPTADLAATVQIPCEIAPEWGYQINAINGTNVYIIYAQSDKFYVSQELDASTCVDNSTVATTCAAASTVYVTL
ncbi:hypothetical protein ASPZODRAFT_955998 [Penicilliopsis zonata CBS 506.65]|uniref:Yeast cell wall synthesis Kre9/Knh1-like N-terminal domain-containing protein n=1 Tax=Penicilliopsis zonata CBS 506.65 TaxID=1073090 RepID=A0A1L9S8K0_9EURO|nr:hypothetical protein ASPZODRAFT_955998 [Penicilliopsis zonata CBS 506.65]OJJ43479.1 hypothetical protein ASPZODRAFT_955998 [Penicilliopsis zonata CBS 506.65]